MRFEITGRNQLKALGVFIMGTTMMLLVLSYFRFENSMLIAFSGLWLLYAIPVFVLHLEYYANNKNQIIEITNEEIRLFENGIKKVDFLKKDIDKLSFINLAAWKQGKFSFLQWNPITLRKYFSSKVITS